jgi:hypothetical protein
MAALRTNATPITRPGRYTTLPDATRYQHYCLDLDGLVTLIAGFELVAGQADGQRVPDLGPT